MPEGDSIARAAAALDRALRGRVVTAFATGLAHLARVDDDTPIAGRLVESVGARGKHLLLTFSGGLVLRTHMRMHGSWHLYRPGEHWRRPARAARIQIDTDAWVAVGFDIPVAEFVPAAGLTRVPALARLGPDLSAPELDIADAAARLAAEGARPLGDVLLDQRVVAGIGNVYRSELPFLARIHPRTPVAAIAPAALERLVTSAADLLTRNARPDAAGGRNTTGRHAPGESLWVYQRTTQPCRVCGAAIVSAVPHDDARREYWCPSCQPDPRVRA